MAFRTTLLTSVLCSCLSGVTFASQTPTQPEVQFELAQQLASRQNSDTQSDVRYWLEQSALQGYIPAQKQLAKDYAHGLSGNADYAKAAYWFSTIALNDQNDRGYLLADFVQRYQNEITTEALIGVWYQLAALKNPQAEAAYNDYLEQRFNRLRAKQVSEIDELDKKATDEEKQEGVKGVADQHAEYSDVWYASGMLGFALIVAGSAFGYRKYNQQVKVHTANEVTKSQQLETQVRELQFANRQLKRRLEQVFKEVKEVKKQKSPSEHPQLALSCAMFGYTPHSIPDSKAVKLRYRQLSKLYHPDSKGTEEEMKRLNLAFKTISQNVAKS
ncbi:J domain-containing protein [Vibrio alfacsensis]|uniref:J domain-containing protein n=1 Tax=Vibrio alfacsensis TaxID=1074311 RepID=UPI004068A014